MPSLRPLGLLLLLGLGGCNVLGALASRVPKPDIDAAYKGLAGKTVGVMVWADKSLMMDWPNLQLDASRIITNKILIAQQSEDKNLKDTKFPYPPESFIKYQKEHPEMEAMGIAEVAPKLGVQRLIYVEVNDLSTRADGGTALYLGRLDATLKIFEVDDKGQATLAYGESNLQKQFPEKSGPEGVLGSNDRAMYAGILEVSTTEIVKRLVQHPDETE